MTKEQEAIKRLKSIDETVEEYDGNILKADIETVLNMLKDMKVQEENYKNLIADVSGIAKELGLEEDGTIDEIYAKIKEKDKDIDKKDKIIDELVKYVESNNYIDNEECQFQWDFNIEKCIGNGDCKDCIKQYFERKSEE